ncbi:MAG: mechanosensitive ion channel family protein [Pseudomonadota bacterium]
MLPTPLIEQLETYHGAFWEALPQIVVALVVLALTWGVSRGLQAVLRNVLTRAKLRRSLIEVLMMLLATGVWILGILVAMTIAFPSIKPANILTALGLGSVAVGLAFKDVFENFLAGIMMLFREPFRLNDYIKCEDIEGQVAVITVRDTHIRRTDGQLVVVPNGYLFKNPIQVMTDRDLRRTTVICGVAYGENVDAAREVILDAVRHVDSVRNDVRDVEVFAQAFNNSSIDFEVTWWTGSRPIDIRQSRDQVVAAVKRALDDAGIEIPFPYRTLVFKDREMLENLAGSTSPGQDRTARASTPDQQTTPTEQSAEAA